MDKETFFSEPKLPLWNLFVCGLAVFLVFSVGAFEGCVVHQVQCEPSAKCTPHLLILGQAAHQISSTQNESDEELLGLLQEFLSTYGYPHKPLENGELAPRWTQGSAKAGMTTGLHLLSSQTDTSCSARAYALWLGLARRLPTLVNLEETRLALALPPSSPRPTESTSIMIQCAESQEYPLEILFTQRSEDSSTLQNVFQKEGSHNIWTLKKGESVPVPDAFYNWAIGPVAHP